MKRVILFTFMIFIIPSLVFAFEQPAAWQMPFFGQKKAPVVRTQQVTGSITISKPLRRSSLKGFLEGEYSDVTGRNAKFQIKISLINSIVCIKKPLPLKTLPVSYKEDSKRWELEIVKREIARRAARKRGDKMEELVATLISIPPIRIWGTDRTQIRIPASVMSYEQVSKLIQPSKSWW